MTGLSQRSAPCKLQTPYVEARRWRRDIAPERAHEKGKHIYQFNSDARGRSVFGGR
jgi:hypothetical protein